MRNSCRIVRAHAFPLCSCCRTSDSLTLMLPPTHTHKRPQKRGIDIHYLFSNILSRTHLNAISALRLSHPALLFPLLSRLRYGSVTEGLAGGSRWARSSCRQDSLSQQPWLPSQACIPVTHRHRQPLRHPTLAWQRDRRLQRHHRPRRQIPLTVAWVSSLLRPSSFLLPFSPPSFAHPVIKHAFETS